MSIKEDINKVEKKIKKIEEQSDLIRIMQIDDRKNKRLCWIIALLVIALALSFGYIIYLHNDIGVIETTQEVTQENDNGSNNFIGNDGNIINGETKDKTN